MRDTPQRVKLMDTFMGFLVVVGALQFLYAVLGGNFVSLPFFLSFCSHNQLFRTSKATFGAGKKDVRGYGI